MENKRIYMLDNLRFVLIVFVVLGHLLEFITFPGSQAIYNAIYSFHMPSMIFLSGLCFNRNKANSWKKIALIYLVFQVIYLFEASWQSGTAFTLQFSTPSWILWYLLSLCIWQIISTSLDLSKHWYLPLGISFLCALLVGYDTQVGYFLSLSRTITFFPFFLTGCVIRENFLESFVAFFTKKKSVLQYCALLCPAMIVQLLLFFQRDLCQNYYFYGSLGYNDNYDIWIRLMIFLSAGATTVAILALTPKKSISVISKIGKNTLPIYVLHGVLLKTLSHIGCLYVLPISKPLYVLLLTLFLVFVLGSVPSIKTWQKLKRTQ